MTAHIKGDIDDLIACPDCDAISESPDIQEGYKAVCIQCGHTLFEKKKDSINRSVAVSLAGLLFLPPALFIPMIGMQAVGQSKDASILECISILIDSGDLLVALLVFLFVIAFPVVRLIAVFYVCTSIKFNRITPGLKTFYRSFHVIDIWSLLNVFFLGIVVSLYKLIALSDVTVDWGLISYLSLLLCSTLVSVTLDNHLIWHILEEESGD